MKLQYSSRARADLRSIANYLREHAPELTRPVVQTIQEQIGQLREHPYLGRPAAELPLRVLTINRYPYLVYYSIDGEMISIVHVRHQRRAPFDPTSP